MQPEEIEAKIKELEEKVVEYENNWKRALADYRNLQKRTDEEKSVISDFVSETILRRFLPILDNLELLQKHLNDTGLGMIIKDFKQNLLDEGVQELEAENQDFDPSTMDAIEMVAGEPNKVVEVLNKGYKKNNKVIRFTKVKVGKKEEN